MRSGEITSKASEFDDIVAQRRSWGRRALVRDQFVEKILIKFREGFCRRRAWSNSIEHGDPEDSPAQDGQDGDETHEPFGGSEFGLFGSASGLEYFVESLSGKGLARYLRRAQSVSSPSP